MRTHNHEVGEQGNFWTLDLNVSRYINPTYADMKALWEATLEDCRYSMETCPAKLVMVEVSYSIISLHRERKSRGENKKGVRLAPWHIHTIIYAEGFSPALIADTIKRSWIKVANGYKDWKDIVVAGRKRDNTYRQGCHCDVAAEKYQTSQHCYSRGKIAYMMWQAIHKDFVCWSEDGKKRNFSEVLRRMKLATRADIAKRTKRKKRSVISDWIEWAKNAKVALANIPAANNQLYHFADMGTRLLHDVETNDSTFQELQSKIQKIPDINTPAQWQKVYDKLVTNLETAGVQDLIADGYEIIKAELRDTKPLLGVYGTGTIEAYRDGNDIRLEIKPNYIDPEMLRQFDDVPKGECVVESKNNSATIRD